MIFLLAVSGLSNGVSLLVPKSALINLKLNYLTILIGFLALFWVFKFKKFSHLLLLLFIVMVVIKSFFYLSFSFNKLVLGLNFIYVLFAFYFFTVWELFCLEAANNPNFSANDLEKKIRFDIEGTMNVREEQLTFYLTNIDSNSCFVLFEDFSKAQLKLNELVHIQINYEGVFFESNAKCISLYDKGCGFSFKENMDNLRSLSGLYNVCLERGIV